MLYVPQGRKNIALCIGTNAELFAVDCLRWRDTERVYLAEKPTRLKDSRVTVGKPPVGSCSVIVLSPDEKPEPYIHALRSDGVISICTYKHENIQPSLKNLRALFPRAICPWREYTPEPLFGALASPSGAPKRQRKPPIGAVRLSEKYLPSLFTFGADETPLIFGPSKAAANGVPHG